MGGFTFNPVLSEIQSHLSAMSPDAQAAVRMANPSLPSAQATVAAQAPSVLPPGMLLPHPDAGPPPGNITMGSPAPTLSPSPMPNVPAPRGTISGETNELGRLLDRGSGISQIGDKIQNSRLGEAHPFLGKLLGGVAQGAATAGDIALRSGGGGIGELAEQMIPGTEGHHELLVNREGKQVNAANENAQREAQAASENATAAKTNADVPLEQAETEQRQQQIAANAPVEITTEQAQSLGMPELAGEKVSSAILARLSGQHQGNATKEDVTGQTVAGREQVAETGAKSREQVAQTAADARKSAEDAQDRTREAVARMRGEGSTGKETNGVTNNSKARGEMSETMLAQAPGILQEIDSLNSKIGPGAGRWNNFWVKKGGANDPDYAALDQDLSLYASALAVAHFGARGGGAHFIDAMKKDFSQAQSPEDLKARILHADKWLEGYEAEGKGDKPGTPAAQPASGDIVVKPEDMK